ncbi:MAG: hydroxymethylglutaryl-CoA lyase [Acetobacterales bacterium]
MTRPDKVRIVEVGPRDGLQNEPVPVSVADRVRLVSMLADAGLTEIEAGAFVSPKWVPQMAGTAQVLAALPRRRGVRYPVLVPNMKGFEAAREAGAREIAVFAAASETFSRKNINCSIDESFERFRPVIDAARAADIAVRGYVSCAVDCPYEGAVPAPAVASVAEQLVAMGCYEVSLGDTIGTATPDRAVDMVETVASVVPVQRLAVHFHDTWGQALANIAATLELGVAVVDSAVSGLGGGPYAKGAAGNVATEDVVYMLKGLGVDTGVELEMLGAAGRFACGLLGRPPASKAALALAARAH